MHIAPGVPAHRHELVHQRQDRVADDVGFLAHMVEVDPLDARFAGDGLGRFGGDHAGLGFGPGKSDFDVDIPLDQRDIGENLAHLAGAECVAEEDGVDDGAGRRGGEHGHGATLER
ncbi:hypothetical protein D3C72_1859620 [compost metagenome]